MKIPRLPRRWLLGAPLAAALVFFIGGIVFWGGFNTVMEATNTLEFCISCHEMKDTVYKEYVGTVHYANRSGVRAVCSDCHVPHPWAYKILRKIQASGELYHKVMGSVDTPEKFEAKRVDLAKRVWATMKATDSRECRNCHTFDAMSKEAQTGSAWRRHSTAEKKRKTCIDCHKGIAHKDVSAYYEEEEGSAPDQE